MRGLRTAALAALALWMAGSAVVAPQPALGTTITIVNLDGANEGFNDPTPVAPVGGNAGTTRGQQRLNVFQHAASIWASILPSDVAIRVQATFDPLTCTPTSAVLGSAGAIEVDANFPNAPFANNWYHIALANKLAGVDRSPGVDDIDATFNSALDADPTCLGGADWYYGFDGNEGVNVDLLPVVLHELGHGLGFSTFTNLTTGALLVGQSDVYARHILDTSTNERWDQMTNAERVASSVNGNNVVWNGSVTTGASPLALGPRPVLRVNAPAAIAGTYAIGTAGFGAALTTSGLSGQVVLADDGVAPNSDACTALVNGAQMAGRVALIDRGTCAFTAKALAAQNAGAIAVIIANNVAGNAPPGLGGSDPSVTIPVVSVTQTDGNTIRNQLANGVNVTIKLDITLRAGADAQGRVLLYAPNPVQNGSSISHFDVSCTPNALMEPAINRDLVAGDVDLTRYHFQDIGWFRGATDAVPPATATRLVGNVPNPFNPSTDIRFELARNGNVRLAIYDLSGRLVTELARGTMTAGPHALRWDGRDASGRGVASGVYVAHLEADGTVDTHRLVLVK